MVMVFVPVSLAVAHALRAEEPASELVAFTATSALVAMLGSPSSEEEADFAALSTAGVAALDGLEGGRWLVLAAEVEEAQTADSGRPTGEVRVARLRWRQVQALFADEEAAADAVRAAAAAATGRTAADALDLPAVVELNDSVDLLWYAPEELDDLSDPTG